MNSTKSTKKKDSIPLKALSDIKGNLSKTLPSVLSYFIIGLLAIALMFLSSLLSYLLMPLVIIPFAFAVSGCLASFPKGGELSNRALFSGYKAYFSLPYYGSYRVVNSYLKALIIGGVASMFLYYILMALFAANNPMFLEEMQSFENMVISGQTNTALDLLNNGSYLPTFVITVSVLEMGSTAVLFVLFLLAEMPNPFFRNTIRGLNSRGIAYLKRAINLKTGGEYRKTLLKCFWPAFVAIPVFFVIGCVVGYYLPFDFSALERTNLMLASGYGGMFLSFAILLPYLVYCSDALVERYSGTAKEMAFEMTQEAIKMAEAQRNYQEEALRQMQQELDEAKRQAEEAKQDLGKSEDNQNPEPKDSDSKDN